MVSAPGEMALRGRIGGHSLHGRYDSRQITAPARAAFLGRFALEADPDGVLDPEERARRAHHLRKAYFAKLALKSAQARRRRAKQGNRVAR